MKMEAFSGVASGIAVISLSFQLIQSVKAIQTFIYHAKGAFVELTRLADLLERLCMLLQDVHKTMERQVCIVEQDSSMTLPTVFVCLHRCESQLQPLRDMIQKFDRTGDLTGSRGGKFFNHVRLGLKAKDIASYETRIQDEINYLQTALVVNATNLQLYALPFLVHKEDTASKHYISSDTGNSNGPVGINCGVASLNLSSLKISRNICLVPSFLNRCNVFQQKASRKISFKVEKNDSDNEKYITIFERQTFYWCSKLFGHAIYLAKQIHCSTLMPSLAVYPVIDTESYNAYDQHFLKGDLIEIQQLFSSNTLHPFTRFPDGRSLLHKAAEHARTDICELLLSCGVKIDLASDGQSPVRYVAKNWHDSQIKHYHYANTFRCLFEHPEQFEEFDNVLDELEIRDIVPLDLVVWFRNQGIKYLEGPKLLRLYKLCFRTLLWWIEHSTDDAIVPLLRNFLQPDVLYEVQKRPHDFLSRLFRNAQSSWESYVQGARFLSLFQHTGVDVRYWFSQDPKDTSDFRCVGAGSPCQVFILRRGPNGEWIFGFDWILDAQAEGFLVVFEYFALGPEEYLGSHWPFKEQLDEMERPVRARKNEMRFDRHLKAKEQRRSKISHKCRGQRTMPGAWIN